jgi:hypothetical protein
MSATKAQLSKNPVILYERPEAPIRGLGDPLLPSLSNLLIRSISGNSDLLHARVTCLDDYHYCPYQKYVRADILNSIIAAKRIFDKPRKVIFMVEGTPFGATPSFYNYDDFIGEDLLFFPHFCIGWDNANLHSKHLSLVQNYSELGSHAQSIYQIIESLKVKRSKLLTDTSIEPDEWDAQIDDLEALIKSRQVELEALCEKLKEMYKSISAASEKRNGCLQEAIRNVSSQFPDADIYVISGKMHFKGLSKAIPRISHAIITLKQIININNPFQALREYYCDQPILLLENFAKEPLLLEAPN